MNKIPAFDIKAGLITVLSRATLEPKEKDKVSDGGPVPSLGGCPWGQEERPGEGLKSLPLVSAHSLLDPEFGLRMIGDKRETESNEIQVLFPVK